MYQRDVPLIRKYVEDESYKGFHSLLMFVLVSIRTRFNRLEADHKDVLSKGYSSKYIWGFKKQAFLSLQESHKELYHQLLDREPNSSNLHYARSKLIEIPGFGIPKASFVLQMLGYPTGCIDSQNWKRLSLGDSFKINDLKKPRVYSKIVRQSGGSEQLWNDWCKYISETQKKHFKDSDDVSRYHYKVISNG